jgi:prevent-host-death family protein
MRSVQVVEAKARFSALLEAVEGGETIAITRHGRIVARLVPDQPRMAADVFRPFWKEEF